MRLTIKGYYKPEDCFVCIDEQGGTHRVDLVIDGSGDSKKIGAAPESMAGRQVDVEYLSPYLEIASGVRLLPKEEQA